ncbi:MAG: hypothetical protein ACRDRE_17540 [Pseudonocardiaceae bacterium]
MGRVDNGRSATMIRLLSNMSSVRRSVVAGSPARLAMLVKPVSPDPIALNAVRAAGSGNLGRERPLADDDQGGCRVGESFLEERPPIETMRPGQGDQGEIADDQRRVDCLDRSETE